MPGSWWPSRSTASASLPTGSCPNCAGAPFGGHAITLAALSADLAAGEEAGEDRCRRWIAASARC
nr:benzoate/H(+) symporter BenE family transporter [Arthrobacter sp. MA-N2]